jgi:hypothetical protein
MVEKKKRLDKKFIPTLAALGVLIILGVAVFFLSKNVTPGGDNTDKNALLNLEGHEVTYISIENPGSPEIDIELNKKDGKWYMREYLAYTPEIENMLTVLSNVSISDTITEYAGESEFGLKPPEKILTLGYKDGTKTRVLVGASTPTSEERYAKMPGKHDIYLVNKYLYSAVTATPLGLLNKDIFKIEPENLTYFEITNPTMTLKFNKKPDGWYVTTADGTTTYGDQQKIMSIVKNIFSNVADSLMIDTTTNLSDYQVETPWIKMIAESNKGEKVEVRFSEKVKGSKVHYGYNLKTDEVFILHSTKLNPLEINDLDVRNKMILATPLSQLSSITIVKDGKKYKFTPNKKGFWTAKNAKIEDLVANQFIEDLSMRYADIVSDLKIAEADEDFGFDDPVLEIIIQRKDQKDPHRAIIGKKSKEGYYYTKVENDPYLFLIVEETLDFIKSMGQKEAEPIKK